MEYIKKYIMWEIFLSIYIQYIPLNIYCCYKYKKK